jgi:lysophospholipase L1-like esterase
MPLRSALVRVCSALSVVLIPAHLALAQAPGAPPQPPLDPALLTADAVAAAVRNAVANDGRLRDWANLARYRDANKTVTTRPDVIFMGDSITDAWVQPRFWPKADGTPGTFFQGKNYIGRGISGQTTPQMLIRMRPDVILHRPRAIVILAGTNDIAGNTGPMTDEEIAGNIESICEIAAANGIKVVLSSILPTSNYHQGPNQPAPQTVIRPIARIRKLNDWMKQYAAAKGHIYLDYFNAMIDAKGLLRTELSGDDLHPNVAGYAIMAPLAQAAIDQALK